MFSKEGEAGINRFFILGIFLIILVISLTSAGWWDEIRASITGRATSQNFNLNISVGNSPPNITRMFVINQTNFDVTEDTIRNIQFYFLVNDTNGWQNINTTSARANFSFRNASTNILRTNDSCVSLGNLNTQVINFSCTVHLWYFDPVGSWNVTAYVEDNSQAVGQNTTENFTVNQVKAFKIQPTAFTFASINPGDTNKTSNNDPLTLNNTGNFQFSKTSQNISVNATNLAGESNGAYALYANNFTVGINTTEGTNTECGNWTSYFMTTSQYANVTNATLPYGNLSAGSGIAQEQLYICLTKVGNEITSQAYSSNGPNSDGAWTVAAL